MKLQTLGLCSLLMVCLAAPMYGETLRIMSANLHGYHPFQASPRYLQNRDGRTERAWAHPFFYTVAELEQSQPRRADAMAQLIATVGADIVAFQEVAGGHPHKPGKTCEDFARRFSPKDAFANTAASFHARLADYSLALVCRGNIGWQTDANTFRHQRVLAETHHGRVVFDFGSNPYPHGMLVEGFAALVKKPLQITASEHVRLPYNQLGETVSFQLLTITDPRSHQVLLIANVHLGHKLAHFEQALAIRNFLEASIAQSNGHIAGSVVIGDFNAYLFDGIGKGGEISTLPWQLHRPGRFDFRSASEESAMTVRRALERLNRDTQYKPWANVRPGQAEHRIAAAIEAFTKLQLQPNKVKFRELLRQGFEQNRCTTSLHPPSTCTLADRIDHVFATTTLQLISSGVLQHDATYSRTDRLSDHPFPIVKLGQ